MARKKNANVTQTENVAAEDEVAEATPNAEGQKAGAKQICLVPGCGREAKIRGLCGRCATAARAQIKKGKTTWADLEKLGLATPPRVTFGGGEQGVFAKAFKNAVGGEGN
jgi:hypothetical protein